MIVVLLNVYGFRPPLRPQSASSVSSGLPHPAIAQLCGARTTPSGDDDGPPCRCCCAFSDG